MKLWIAILAVAVVGAVAGTIVYQRSRQESAEAPSPTPNETTETPVSKTMILETNYGKIKIILDTEAAPKTAANFAKLVADKFYDGLTFHRIIPEFVIQGGDPSGNGTGGPGYTTPAEIKLTHKRGSVATARLPDEVNPSRESSGSQFYIALQDLPLLDGQYTVFGQVVEGMDVVDQIAAVKTDASDKPLEAVIINKAYAE